VIYLLLSSGGAKTFQTDFHGSSCDGLSASTDTGDKFRLNNQSAHFSAEVGGGDIHPLQISAEVEVLRPRYAHGKVLFVLLLKNTFKISEGSFKVIVSAACFSQ